MSSPYGDVMITGLNYTGHSGDTSSADDIFHFVGRLHHVPKDSVITLRNNSGAPDPAMIDFINYGTFPESGTVFAFVPVIKPTPVPVTEIEENANVLFPNPVMDYLTIQLSRDPGNGAAFILYDMAGRERIHSNIKLRETTIPVSFLTKGIYLGTIITWGKKETARIVKQ